MKMLSLAFALLLSMNVHADKFGFAGSSTLAGAMEDAINRSLLQDQLVYASGGSGKGEDALVAGNQGIAPMSRAIKAEAVAKLAAKGVTAVPHILGLDGLTIFVNKANTIASIDLPTVSRIYACEFTDWSQVPNSGRTGAIKAYRRDDASGTSSSFKDFTGMKTYGACTIETTSSDDMASKTEGDANAIGYAGKSATRENNRAVALAKAPGVEAVLPTDTTIRNFSYPMSRYLYVYEATGAAVPSEVERAFLDWITDRDNMDQVMQDHDFTTID